MTGPEPSGGPGAPAATGGRGRARLVSVRFQRTSHGRCHTEVTLDWGDRKVVAAGAEDMASAAGELRSAAQAAVNALEAGGCRPRLALLGTRAVRAFDSNVVIVALTAHEPSGPMRLVGSALGEDDDLPSIAVRAVLHAANRLITRP